MAEPEDLYAALGVSRSATDDEIRRAYRKLARKYHPDVNPGDKVAEDRFKQISAAYDVLSNPTTRKTYDEFGAEGLRGGFDPEKARAYRRWSEGRSAAGSDGGEVPFEFDVGDLFGDSGRPRRPRRRAATAEDVVANVELDFLDALRGAELEFRIPVPRTCPTCDGSGDKPGTRAETCPECGGSGRVQAVDGPMRIFATCPTCGGTGVRRTPCPTCDGDGIVTREEKVRVRIPPGADDGSELRVRGKGMPGTGGEPPGDLIIRTRVRPHPHFRREGLDLFLQLPVTLEEAYGGATVEVPTPDGPVQLKIPPRSQTGTRLRLRAKGVAREGERGDLYVDLVVRLPDQPDDSLADALRGSSRLYSRPVREGIRL